MALNQYIGARYVPLIEGEWNSTMNYEPLTVVTYQGNSYTSICSVPAGIVPTDTSFWAMTGNYNAQVEMYRQEVAKLQKDVDDLTVFITPELFGAKGDGVTDDTHALQQAFNKISDGVKLVSNSSKTYLVSSPIIITNNSLNVVDLNDATIKASSTMESVIIIDGHNPGGIIKNITIDCNSQNCVGLKIKDAMHISIHHLKIINVSTLAVNILKGYEILLHDSEFIGVGSVAKGFEIETSDSLFFNLSLVNFHIAFNKTNYSNYFDHIHAWIADTVPAEAVNNSIMFNIDGNYCTFENCESDTYHYTFNLTKENLVNISNMLFFVSQNVINDTRTPGVTPTIFNALESANTNSVTVNQIYGYGAPKGQDKFCNVAWGGRCSNANLIGFTDVVHENFVGGTMPTLGTDVTLVQGSLTKDSSVATLTLLLKVDNVTPSMDKEIFVLSEDSRPANPLTFVVGLSATNYKVNSAGYGFIDSTNGNCTINIPELTGVVYATITLTYLYQNKNFSG